MRVTGKLDYLEMPVATGDLEETTAFYGAAFGWEFTPYGPTYAAFSEGLDGGFDASPEAARKPLPVLYAENLEECHAAVQAAGGVIVQEIFTFPGGRRFHFRDPAGNELAVWSE